jgi:hypothetical protein
MRHETYFNDKKLADLIRLAFCKIPTESLRGTDIQFKDVYESYAANVLRTLALAKYTPVMALTALTAGQWYARAHFEEYETFDYRKPTLKTSESIELRMQRENYLELKMVADKTVTNNICGAMRVILKRSGDDVVSGLDATMPSLIISAWTAFETLCEDLLKKAIQISPSLSPPQGWKTRRKMPKWEGVSLTGNIQTHSAVFKKPPGADVLGFRSIKAIRDAYWITFFVDRAAIDRTLHHRSIDNLYAVRNILVHTGGRVDDIFLKRTIGVKMFSAAKLDKTLQLDFRMVKNMVVPIFNRGITLFAAVNRWLLDHK